MNETIGSCVWSLVHNCPFVCVASFVVVLFYWKSECVPVDRHLFFIPYVAERNYRTYLDHSPRIKEWLNIRHQSSINVSHKRAEIIKFNEKHFVCSFPPCFCSNEIKWKISFSASVLRFGLGNSFYIVFGYSISWNITNSFRNNQI